MTDFLAATMPTVAGDGGSTALLFFVFVMAIFLGFELISKVPSQLHTPLMSGSNAISGITIVGALLATGLGGGLTALLGFCAVVFAIINVVGGYQVTDRMLGMFKKREGGSRLGLPIGIAVVAALFVLFGGRADYAYIVASIYFVFGLKMLGRPESAQRGNLVSAIGMIIAIIAVLATDDIRLGWIIFGLLIGSAAGTYAAKTVPMTEMPEMVALFNGFGGIASFLVGWAEYDKLRATAGDFASMTNVAIYLAVLIGGVTFTGSLIAWGKLSGKVSSKPIMFDNQRIVNAALLAAVAFFGLLFCRNPADMYAIFVLAMLLALALGVLAVIPIGGGDMPVVIALLNSYSGLAACAAGFVIQNTVLIVAGALVGASGLILTNIMCKAMNRSLGNVLFSGFGSAATSGAGGAEVAGEAKPITSSDAYIILEAAASVVIVPGYGMAVAQAQHVVRELGDLLAENGAEVKYAIHPVAGRMPGHMNVLLAEANVPYEQLVEMDDINPTIANTDVAIVIGANDVVNPAAREIESSPIYGMPIINVDHAKTVFVLKRTMASGFAGIDNPLFFKDNTRMLFGDAKESVSAIVAEFKGD